MRFIVLHHLEWKNDLVSHFCHGNVYSSTVASKIIFNGRGETSVGGLLIIIVINNNILILSEIWFYYDVILFYLCVCYCEQYLTCLPETLFLFSKKINNNNKLYYSKVKKAFPG